MQYIEAKKSNTLNLIFICAAVLIVGFYLMTEHRAHTFGALPYLLILACPLMHIFMHRNHGDHKASKVLDSGQTGRIPQRDVTQDERIH